MSDSVITALLGIVGTLIGVLLGFLLSNHTARQTIKRQEFNKAAADFHTAFIEAQRRLDESKSFDILNPDGERVRDILARFIIEHERAMIKFRPYINKSDRTSFDKAWKEYYSQETKHSECLGEYKSKNHDIASGIDIQHEDKIRKLALSRIEKLLYFIELK